MFDIGMTELLVVAVVAIIVVGPKDLPGLLRTGAKHLGQLRSMARDFQGQVSEAIKDTELDEVRDTWKDVSDLNPVSKLKNEVSDYMDSARSFDEPDESYVAEGDAMAKAAESDAAKPAPAAKETPAKAAVTKKAATAKKPTATKKPATPKTVTQKAVTQKTVTKKTAAKKPSTTTAKAPAKKTSAKRATSKASS